MSLIHGIGLAIAAALALYLFVALFRPEKF